MSESQFYGFDFHSRQPCVRIAQQMELGSLRDTKHVDSWLLEHLAVDPENISPAQGPSEDGERALALAVVVRALALYGELLRASGFPCFDRGRVLQLRPVGGTPNSYHVIVALPAIDNLPMALLGKLFQDALRLVLVRLFVEPTREAIDALFAQLDKAVVKEFSNAVPFGSSTLPICQLAFQREIPFRHVGNGLIRFGWGARSQLLQRSTIERDSAIGANICNDKQLTAHMLKVAGLPIPDHYLVSSHEKAIEAARQLGWPVVVKPSDRARSVGVSVNIRTEAALLEAYDQARSRSKRVLVERHVPGECHRIMIAKDRIAYVVKRKPKGVMGNGRNTVSELIAIDNAKYANLPPWKRVVVDGRADELAARSLAEVGLTLQSVPDEGQWAPLRPFVSEEWGGVVEDLTDEIHPENAQLAIAAARALGMSLAGVDLMSIDISRPWHENGAVINEMNFMPQVATFGREIRGEHLCQALVEGDGRIPVHLVTGEGDLLGAARDLKRRLSNEGRKCHLTTAGYTEDGEGREMVMHLSTLFERSLTLTMRPDVHEFVLVGQTAELFARGLAVDRLESAYVVDDDPERGERLVDEIRARFPVQSCLRVTR